MKHKENETPDCRVEIWNQTTQSFALCEMYFNNSTQNYILTWPFSSGDVKELRTVELTECEMRSGQFNQETKRLRLEHLFIENDVFVQKASFPGSN